MHTVIQVPPDGVVGSRNCHCHPFAASTIDVTECFKRQTVSACPQASRAILHSRHHDDGILPILVRKLILSILIKNLPVGQIPATAIPKCLLRFHEIDLSLKRFPSMNFPSSCLSKKSATHVP